ncbi:hypothetical protein AB0A70_22075 [Streptomyces morookaense]|uniref:hypothetical protein n=1 Tax=Streptomyces morookaense TaxID=1970 RepID=UPI00340BE002
MIEPTATRPGGFPCRIRRQGDPRCVLVECGMGEFMRRQILTDLDQHPLPDLVLWGLQSEPYLHWCEEHSRYAAGVDPWTGEPEGGPLLWPTDEPWPMCTDPTHWKPLRRPTELVGPDPVAMVPVAQLYARDVPDLPFPEGTDVLRVLWCPLIHDGQDTVLPQLYWRCEAEVRAVGVDSNPPAPREHDEEFVPRPCTVSPTRATEYPNWDIPANLSHALEERFEGIERRFGFSYFDVATTPQSKVGGYPGWTQPPQWPDCACGRRMEHLLSVTASEPTDGRWLPSDEHRPGSESANPAVLDAIGHGMDMGDCGGLYLFVCPACPGMPYAHRYDC